jgi:hypothetical protein
VNVVSWFEESDQEAARQMQEAARQRQEQLKQTFDRKNPTVSQKRQATDFRSMSPAAFLDRYPETAAELAKLPDNISRSQFANAVGVPTSVVGKNGRQRMNEFVAAARDIAAQKLRQPPFPESQLPPLPAEMGGDPNLETAAGINAAQLQNLSNAELQALYGGSRTKNKKDNLKAIAPDAPRQAAPPKSVIRDFDDLTSDQFAAKYPDKAQAAEALRTMPLNEIKKQLGLKRSTNRRDVLNMLLNTGERSLPQQQQQPAPAPPVAQQPVVEQVAPAPPMEQVAPPVEPEQPAPVTAAPPPPQPTLSQAAREVLAQLSNEDTDGLLALADMFKVKLPKKGTKAHKEMTDDMLREMVAVAMTSGKGVGSIDLGGSTPAATSAEPTPSPQEPSTPAEAPAPAPPAKSARESWKEAKAARNQAKKQQRDNPPAAEPPPQKVPDRNAKNAITGVKLTPEQRTQLKENLKGLSKQDRVAYWENARNYEDPLHLYHPRAFARAQANYVLAEGREQDAVNPSSADVKSVADSARAFGYSKGAQDLAGELFLTFLREETPISSTFRQPSSRESQQPASSPVRQKKSETQQSAPIDLIGDFESLSPGDFSAKHPSKARAADVLRSVPLERLKRHLGFPRSANARDVQSTLLGIDTRKSPPKTKIRPPVDPEVSRRKRITDFRSMSAGNFLSRYPEPVRALAELPDSTQRSTFAAALGVPTSVIGKGGRTRMREFIAAARDIASRQDRAQSGKDMSRNAILANPTTALRNMSLGRIRKSLGLGSNTSRLGVFTSLLTSEPDQPLSVANEPASQTQPVPVASTTETPKQSIKPSRQKWEEQKAARNKAKKERPAAPPVQPPAAATKPQTAAEPQAPPSARDTKKVVTAVKLTPEQRGKLKEILKDLNKQDRAAYWRIARKYGDPLHSYHPYAVAKSNVESRANDIETSGEFSGELGAMSYANNVADTMQELGYGDDAIEKAVAWFWKLVEVEPPPESPPDAGTPAKPKPPKPAPKPKASKQSQEKAEKDPPKAEPPKKATKNKGKKAKVDTEAYSELKNKIDLVANDLAIEGTRESIEIEEDAGEIEEDAGSEENIVILSANATVYGNLALLTEEDMLSAGVEGPRPYAVYLLPSSGPGIHLDGFPTRSKALEYVRLASGIDPFVYASYYDIPDSAFHLLRLVKFWTEGRYSRPNPSQENLLDLQELHDAILAGPSKSPRVAEKLPQAAEEDKKDLPKRRAANKPEQVASENKQGKESQKPQPDVVAKGKEPQSETDNLAKVDAELRSLVKAKEIKGKRGNITLELPDGKQQSDVPAIVYGNLAMHQLDDGKWGVTSVPLGLGAGNYESASQARNFIRVALLLDDFSATSQDQFSPELIRRVVRAAKWTKGMPLDLEAAKDLRDAIISRQQLIASQAAEQQRAAVTAPPPAKKASKAVLAAAKQDAKAAPKAAADVLTMSNGHTAVLRSGMLYETEIIPSTWTSGRIGYSEPGASLPVQGAALKDDAYYQRPGATTTGLKQHICDAIAKKAGGTFKIEAVESLGSRSTLDLPFISKHIKEEVGRSATDYEGPPLKPASAKRLVVFLGDIQRFLNRLPIASAGLQRVTVDLFATDNKALRGFAYKNHIFLSRAALLNNEVDVVWGLVGHELAHATSIDRLHELFGENLVKEFSAKYYKKTSQWYRDLLDQDPAKLYREGVAQLIQEFMSNAKFRDSLMKKEPKGLAWLVEKFFQLLGLADNSIEWQSHEMKKAAEKIRELFNSSNYDNSDRMLFSDVGDSAFSVDDPVMLSAEEDLDTAAERVKKKLATQVKRRAISVMQKYARRAVREVLSKDKSTPPPPPEMLAAAAERQLKAAMAELEQMTPVPGFTIKPAREFDMEVMAEYLRRRPDGYNEYASKYTKPPFQSPNYESWPSREFRRQAKAASAAPPLNREEQRARVQRAFGRANPATTVAGRQKILEMDMRLGPAEARPRQEAIEMAAARTAGKGMRKETDAFLERFRSGNFSPLPHEADYIVLRSILDEATVGQAMQGGDQALEDLLLLHKGYRDSRSELARNLSLRDPIARDPATRIRRAINHSIFDQTNIPLIKKIMDALEKEGIDINSPEFAESLELAARALAIILGVKKRESQGPVHSYFDMQYEFYLNSIMSGMQTQVANVAGNAFNIVWTNGIERTVEVAVSKATRGKLSDDQQVRDFRELGEMYKAMGGAIGTALANAKIAWKHEYSPVNLVTDHRNEFSDMTRASFAIPGKAGRVVRAFGFRQLAFADEFFRTIAAHGAAAVQAYRLAKQHGVTDEDMSRFIEGHVSNYASPVWQAAMAEADLQTFQQQGGEISGAFKQSASWLKDKVPGVRYVVPFSNFLVNSFSRAAELTPGLGLAVAAFNGSRGGNVNWNRVAAQQLLAMGLYAAISAVADDRDEDGLPTITGTKEFNNGRRGLQYMTAPPMSVKIGGRYYSYARIEPLNTMLSAAVDFADGVASGDNVAGSLPASFFRQVDDKNYMQSIEDLLKIFRSEEPGRETADYAGSLAVGFVPNIYRQAKREIRNVVTDTTSKKGDDLATYAKRMMMKAELPGIGYAYRYDIWGRPMQTNAPSTWAVYRILSPIKVKDRADVLPVNAAIVRWNEKMEAENRDDERISTEIPRYPKVGNVRITMEEYEQYAREAGKYAYDAVKGRKFPVNMTKAHAKGIEDALQRGRDIALYRLKKRLADGK